MVDFEEGFHIGILFHWLAANIPGSKLFGPYRHGGKHYFQWMVRVHSLREELLPILRRHVSRLDSYVRGRVEQMIERYGLPELQESAEDLPAPWD
jgi:hypothetical protein